MQFHNLRGHSEMAESAGYDAERRTLYLTYASGKTTIAYEGVTQETFRELTSCDFPDVCIRFRVQALHPFRRVEMLEGGFIK